MVANFSDSKYQRYDITPKIKAIICPIMSAILLEFTQVKSEMLYVTFNEVLHP